MRIATCLLMFAIAITGCKRDDHTEPKMKPQAKAADAEKKEVAQNQPAPVPQPPPKKEGNPPPGKQGGKSIVGNIRGKVERTTKEVELRKIQTVFMVFCDATPKSARTLDAFLADLKTEGNVYQWVKEGFYQMNMKADHRGTDDIVAYERDEDVGGVHLCVKANNFIGYVSAQDLKKALGNP